MKTTKISIIIFLLTIIIFYGCQDKGTYQYVITMKDGSKVKAWNVTSDGGGLSVWPPIGEGGSYYLSSDAYIRADYVGTQNNKKEK